MMDVVKLPTLGVGLNYRPELKDEILNRRDAVDFVEVITERAFGNREGETLDRLVAAYPIVCHGLELSIGSMEPLDEDYLAGLDAAVNRLRPVWFSDHLSLTRIEEIDLGHLVPLTFTEEVLRNVVEKVARLQDAFALPFLLENIAYYFAIPGPDMAEWEFLARAVERTDCGLLLDLNNLSVNSKNHGYDPWRFLAEVPLDRVVEIHIGGAASREGLQVDTHGSPVSEEVWELLADVCKRAPVRAIVLERDQDIPPFAAIVAELERARAILASSAPGADG